MTILAGVSDKLLYLLVSVTLANAAGFRQVM